MKIYLTDPGDPTVGIFSRTFEIPCPFEPEDVTPEDLELFRKDIAGLYRAYDAPVKAEYDFELQKQQP